MRNVYGVRERYGNGCQTKEGLTVMPRQGSVLLFYNLEPNGATKDFFSWHGSCDVLHGEKWGAIRPRTGSLPPEIQSQLSKRAAPNMPAVACPIERPFTSLVDAAANFWFHLELMRRMHHDLGQRPQNVRSRG